MSSHIAMFVVIILLIAAAVWAFYEPHPSGLRPQGSAFTIQHPSLSK